MSTLYEPTLFSSLQSLGIEGGRSLQYWLGVYLRKTDPPISPSLRYVLETLRSSVDREDFPGMFFLCSEKDLGDLLQLKPSSIREFIKFRNDLLPLCQEGIPLEGSASSPFPSNIQEIIPLVEDRISDMPGRMSEIAGELFEATGKDIREFYAKILMPRECLGVVKYIRSSLVREMVPRLEELRDFIATVLSEQEVRRLLSERLSLKKSEGDLDSLTGKTFPSNIQDVLPILKERISSLPSRAANCLHSILSDCGGSVKVFYLFLLDPEDKYSTLSGIGEKTKAEMTPAVTSMKDFLSAISTEQDVKREVEKFSFISQDGLGLGERAWDEVSSLRKKLGHAPLFLVVREFISTRSAKELPVLDKGLAIYSSRSPLSVKELSAHLCISRERTRQLRASALDSIREFVLSLKGQYREGDYPFLLSGGELEEAVNSSEGTDFNGNFILWVLSLLSEGKIAILGDPVHTLLGSPRGGGHIIAVDGEVGRYFSFKGFLSKVGTLSEVERLQDEVVPLGELMAPFIREGAPEGTAEAARKNLDRILPGLYPSIYRNDGTLLFPSNKFISKSEILEEILLSSGVPMTLGEVEKAFRERCPGSDFNGSSTKAILTKSENIVPIGVSGRYVHVSFRSKVASTETERAFVRQLLKSSPSHILPVEEVITEVQAVNSSRSRRNISANIKNKTGNGDFQVYYLGGVVYLGLPGEQYPREYFPSYITAKRDSVYYPRLRDYIRTEGHFPFDDVPDLQDFYLKQKSSYEGGTIPAFAKKWYESIMGEFGGYAPTEVDFVWLIHYMLIANETGMDLGEDTYLAELGSNLGLMGNRGWLQENIDLYLDSPENMAVPLRERFVRLVSHLCSVQSRYKTMASLSGIPEIIDKQTLKA